VPEYAGFNDLIKTKFQTCLLKAFPELTIDQINTIVDTANNRQKVIQWLFNSKTKTKVKTVDDFIKNAKAKIFNIFLRGLQAFRRKCREE
jgi:hypothetical protein